MRRIVFCTPVNPVSSGISDYSEELLPELGRYLDITVAVEDGVRPTNKELLRHLPVEPISRIARLHRRRPFDALIYHVGNSPAHSGIYDLLCQLPGVVVLHDYVLQHLMLWRAANVHKRLDRYVDEMSRRYGPDGEAVGQQMARGRLPEAAFNYPLVEEVVARARGLISHSRYIAERAAALRPDLPLAIVPMGVPLPADVPRAEARARLGLPQEALIWASFGHINPYKRLEAALRAFRRLLAEYPGARYVLVGSVSPNYPVEAVVKRMGLDDAVQVTGHVPAEQFADYVAAADLCLNLRHPTAGETSASLLRLLGAGRPVLVSATGSFAELPPGVAAQVDVDACEEELILAYARALAGDRHLAETLGRQARDYVAREHTLQGAAAGYVAFLSRLYGWEEQHPQRPALWDVAQAARAAQAAEVPARVPAAPALPVSAVADALASLNLGAPDVVLLDRLAQRLRGLL